MRVGDEQRHLHRLSIGSRWEREAAEAKRGGNGGGQRTADERKKMKRNRGEQQKRRDGADRPLVPLCWHQ